MQVCRIAVAVCLGLPEPSTLLLLTVPILLGLMSWAQLSLRKIGKHSGAKA